MCLIIYIPEHLTLEEKEDDYQAIVDDTVEYYDYLISIGEYAHQKHIQ